MAGKNKTYELMLKIGGKVDGSLKTACSTATRTWLRWENGKDRGKDRCRCHGSSRHRCGDPGNRCGEIRGGV